jgi:hypothetical protein
MTQAVARPRMAQQVRLSYLGAARRRSPVRSPVRCRHRRSPCSRPVTAIETARACPSGISRGVVDFENANGQVGLKFCAHALTSPPQVP